MTIAEAYLLMRHALRDIYTDTESALISRFVFEDLIDRNIRSARIMDANEMHIFQEAIRRLKQHEPWQYVCGMADFYGLKFKVSNAVLIPRPETEELVDHALEVLKSKGQSRVLDVGTGSGAIIIALAKSLQMTEAVGLDVSEQALSIARYNAHLHKSDTQFICLDILDKTQWAPLGRFDLVVSNPPYIGTEESATMARHVLEYEPHLALFAHGDVLKFYRALAEFTALHGNDHAHLLVEINENYGKEVAEIFRRRGLEQVAIIKDMQGKDRIVSGVKQNQDIQ
jgi:release factor glutamine methyltransferase